MNSVVTVIAFVLAVGLLVTIHELGHFWVARLMNVKILRFSIGFGKPLWLRRSGPDRTEWVVAAIPLGGFVRMLDERDADVAPAERHRTFNRQHAWKRIAIMLAGPVANFLLAGLIYWMLFVHGTPGDRPYVAAPPAGTPAAASGLADFDLIRKIDGSDVATWSDVRWILLKQAVQRGVVEIETAAADGKTALHRLSLEGITKDDLDKDFLGKLGLAPYRPLIEAVVGQVLPGMPAEKAGLRPGDRIVSAAGQDVPGFEDLVGIVNASPGKPVELRIRRGAEEFLLTVVPAEETDRSGKRVGRIGIGPRIDPEFAERFTVTVRYDPLTAVAKAGEKVVDMSVFSLKMLGRMIVGDISWKNLSGPITIADYAGQSARLGIAAYLGFLALVSVSIGVLNLLPIPVLDGGQLVYYVVEIVKGSPVSARVMELGQQVGLALLLGLTAFAFYNDIHRLIAG